MRKPSDATLRLRKEKQHLNRANHDLTVARQAWARRALVAERELERSRKELDQVKGWFETLLGAVAKLEAVSGGQARVWQPNSGRLESSPSQPVDVAKCRQCGEFRGHGHVCRPNDVRLKIGEEMGLSGNLVVVGEDEEP